MTPHEISIAGVYFPPLLLAAGVGLILTSITTRILNRMRWTRFFYYPPLIVVALAVIYTGLVGSLWIPY